MVKWINLDWVFLLIYFFFVRAFLPPDFHVLLLAINAGQWAPHHLQQIQTINHFQRVSRHRHSHAPIISVPLRWTHPIFQFEQKKFLQQHKIRADSYSKAAATMKKQRKKKSSAQNADKEIKVSSLSHITYP